MILKIMKAQDAILLISSVGHQVAVCAACWLHCWYVCNLERRIGLHNGVIV